MPSTISSAMLIRLCLAQTVISQQHPAVRVPERKKPINFFKKLTKNRNEISVYHRVGHLCDPDSSHSHYCQQQSPDDNALVHQSATPEVNVKTEPFSGMILHVHDDAENFGVEKRSRGDINLYHRPCCHKYEHAYSQNSPKEHYNKYQLVEVLQEDLGSKNIHNHDFAYRPVVALPSSEYEKWRDDEYWWDNENQNHEFRGSAYEKMGERAFAGGTHGEVWRAKRRCNQVVVNLATESQHFSNMRYGFEQKPSCIEGESLVMKRLKVGKSYALMEAGLREIYFGLSRTRCRGRLTRRGRLR